MTQSMPLVSDLLGAPAKRGRSTLDNIVRPLAKRLQDDHMSALGIANTMRLARDYNWIKYRRQHAWRNRLYREQFEALLAENGGLTRPRIELNDGYAIDTSMSFPHLDRILDVSEEIIEERSGVVRRQYRSFFQNIWTEEYVRRYPAFLDFATSSDILAPVGDTLRSIPIMSTTAPPGIRFVESSEAFDTDPTRPKDSQLYHIDPYSLPNLYVIVLLRDTTHEHGPLTFLPRSISQRAAKELGYWSRGVPYRMPDEAVYSVVDPKEVIEFVGARGSVLFIELSGCFHYGSRNSVKPRYQLMLGYTGALRTDFTEVTTTPKLFPIRSTDSRLRKLALDRGMLE